MFHSDIIKSLNEEEISLLMFVMNKCPVSGEELFYSEKLLTSLKKPVIIQELENIKPLLKEENITGVFNPLVEKLNK